MVRIVQGDCLDLMRQVGNGSIDAIITDPPYGTTACRWDSIIDLDLMWEHLKRIIKPNGAIVLFGSQPFSSVLVSSNLKMFKQSLVWAKNKGSGHLNAKRRHMTKHEDIFLFSDKQSTYNPQKSSGHSPANYAKRSAQSDCYGFAESTEYTGGNTDRYPTTLLEFPVMNNDRSHGEKVHPTQKPVPLMEYLIKTYTNESETVLDFAMGSGTTGVACKNLNRNFIGIEKDQEYFKIAKNRIDQEYAV